MPDPKTTELPPILAALAGTNPGPPPLWMMRQAGRTLASYRALREGIAFLDFCKDVDRAAAATLIPVRELKVDAAILFADILLVAEALGLGLRFEEGVGPIVEPNVADATVAAGLTRGRAADHCGYVGEVVAKVRSELPDDVVLIGFVPSPWTLAAYMVEGRGKRGFPTLKRFLYHDPEGFGAFFDMLTELLIDYAHVQLAGGIQAIQVFDTWAELLPPPVFRDVVRPRVDRLLRAVDAVPRIYFPKGTAGLLDSLEGLPAEGISCDWTVELPAVRRKLGPELTLQGNLDPTVLLAGPETIATHTHRMLDAMAGDPAYIVNLGHGLSPGIPEAHVHAFVEAVRSWQPPAAGKP